MHGAKANECNRLEVGLVVPLFLGKPKTHRQSYNGRVLTEAGRNMYQKTGSKRLSYKVSSKGLVHQNARFSYGRTL